jgi:hypothetical protein
MDALLDEYALPRTTAFRKSLILFLADPVVQLQLKRGESKCSDDEKVPMDTPDALAAKPAGDKQRQQGSRSKGLEW